MHAARWVLGLSATFSVFAAVAAGCGGGTSNSTPPADSGSGEDVTTDAAPAREAAVEAGPDVMEATVPEAAPMCVPDAQLMNLPVPDASLGDSGATAASCLSCFESSCPTIVAACNMDCACVAAYQQFGSCLATGAGLISCIGTSGLATSLPGVSLTDFACAAGCATPTTCGFSFTIPTGDGGSGDGGAAGDSGATTGDGAADQ